MNRLLYVAPFFNVPPTSGAELRAVRLAEQLAVDWKITVLIPSRDSQLEVERWAEKRGIQVVWMECKWRAHKKSDFPRIFAARPPGFSALSPECIMDAITDVSKKHGPFTLVYLATQLIGQVLLKRNWVETVILDLYDLYTPLARQKVKETHIFSPYHWLFLLEAIRIEDIERRIMGKAELCLLPSEAEIDFSRKEFGLSNLEVIPNGVALPPLAKKRVSSSQVLMIGSMYHKPNLEGFLWFYEHVWYAILADNPAARLCLVGSGQEVLPETIQSDNSIILAGQVPDIKPYYASSCCAVVPILRGGGTRLKLLEAMSWGIPVVTTKAGCTGIDHQNKILITDDPTNFAAYVLACIGNPDAFKEHCDQARSVILENYTWDHIGDDLRKQLRLLQTAV